MPRFNIEDYVDVQTRIVQFWERYPDGAILTELMSDPNDFSQCRYRATVYKHRDDARPSAVDFAFELAGGTGANQTSHEENCCTSAIGRALATLGLAKSREDRPSRQEMAKVNKATANVEPTPFIQHQPADADAARMRRLHAVAAERGLSHDELHAIAKGRGKDSLKDLQPRELDTFTNWLEKVTPPNLQAAIDAGRAPEVAAK